MFHAIEKGRATSVFSEEEKELLRKTVRLLPAIQFAGADGFDFSRCYPQPEFNQRSILWDLNYFKYCFLKATGMEFQEDKLEDDFQKMSDVLLRSSSATFMYRDFQSRNVMIKDGEPWFIDFQGGPIREYGVLQPVIVRLVEDKYQLVSGERRFRASTLAGKETIPALVRQLNDREVAEMALIENLQREDLNYFEEADYAVFRRNKGTSW